MSESNTITITRLTTLTWLSMMPLMRRLLDCQTAPAAMRLRVYSTGECEWVLANPACSLRWFSADAPPDTVGGVAEEVWLDGQSLEIVRCACCGIVAQWIERRADGCSWVVNYRAAVRCNARPHRWPDQLDGMFDEPWSTTDVPSMPWDVAARDLSDLSRALEDVGDHIGMEIDGEWHHWFGRVWSSEAAARSAAAGRVREAGTEHHEQ